MSSATNTEDHAASVASTESKNPPTQTSTPGGMFSDARTDRREELCERLMDGIAGKSEEYVCRIVNQVELGADPPDDDSNASASTTRDKLLKRITDGLEGQPDSSLSIIADWIEQRNEPIRTENVEFSGADWDRFSKNSWNTMRMPETVIVEVVRLFGLEINQSAEAFNMRLDNVVGALNGTMGIEGVDREAYPNNRYPHETAETDDDAETAEDDDQGDTPSASSTRTPDPLSDHIDRRVCIDRCVAALEHLGEFFLSRLATTLEEAGEREARRKAREDRLIMGCHEVQIRLADWEAFKKNAAHRSQKPEEVLQEIAYEFGRDHNAAEEAYDTRLRFVMGILDGSGSVGELDEPEHFPVGSSLYKALGGKDGNDDAAVEVDPTAKETATQRGGYIETRLAVVAGIAAAIVGLWMAFGGSSAVNVASQVAGG